MAGLLSLELQDAVATVTLRRPGKRNALSIDLRLELADAFARLAAADDVACVVLTGAGTAFCAGMDTSQFGGDRANRELLVSSSIEAFRAVAAFPKPLVAAVNGPAVAGGFVLALHADLRLASETARFGFSELPQGIPPSYAAALAGLPEPLARDLCLTGRMLDAPEALRVGLVRSVHPPDVLPGAAMELASKITQTPREALREVKRRILVAAERARGPLFADEERVLRAALLGEPPPDEVA